MLGELDQAQRRVTEIVTLANTREESARRNRYLLSSEDYLEGENEASRLGLEVLGVFHSHPNHPNLPSEYDRQWAWPNFSYLITSVMMGKAQESRSWRLAEDRSNFVEEELEIVAGE